MVVDDEPLSQEIVVDFVEACPELELLATCCDALEAGQILKKQKVDLLFLDINMPRLSGIEFMKSLKESPLFILITAYPEFALDGFEVDAVDYLVKPVSFDRFRTAVNRVVERFAAKEMLPVNHIILRANKKMYRIDYQDILLLEAQGDYVRFITRKQTLMVHGKLKDFEQSLPTSLFLRIHKSYVVALNKVEYVEGNLIKVGDYKLPVSLNYRDSFIRMLAR